MGWVDDFTYAGRRLLRSPGFSATAIAILVLGIGVNSTAFSFVNALLFQPPPFNDPAAVVDVLQDSDDGRPNSTSYPAFLDITDTDGVFSSVAAFTTDRGFMDQDGVMLPVMIEYATSTYMDVVGLSPVRGRWFDRAEDDASGPPALVVSHKTWQDRMGADPGIVGTTLRIGGGTVEVVGVGPREFNGGTGPVAIDFWLSISAMGPTGARVASLTRRADHPFTVRARLGEGVGQPQAQAAMDRLAEYLDQTYPEFNEGRRISVLPVVGNGLPPDVYGALLPGAMLAMIVVGLVLLIGTLNLANLLLVRTTARAHEIAVRLAIGAGRARVVRVVVSEALLLALLGGVGALGFTIWVVRVVSDGVLAAAAGGARFDVRLDAVVLLFTLGVSLSAGLVFGLVPALRVTSRDLTVSLREEVRVKIGAARRFGLTGLLVAGQVTVSLVLLAVAGVFLESLYAAGSANPGFRTENTAYVQFSAQPIVSGVADIVDVIDRIEEEVERSPAVRAASFAMLLPAAHFGTSTLLLGAGVGRVDEPVEVPWNSITSDYFEVLGISLLHGRVFGPEDGGGPPVTVVSEALARSYWGRPDVVGESLRHENDPDEPVEIIGVVADVPVRALGEAPTPSFYRPLEQWAAGRGHVVFQFTGPAQQAIAAANEAIRAVDSQILILQGASLVEHLGETLGQRRLVGGVLSLLGSLALGLALLGIYGVVSFAVARRRHEVGIRLALGAARNSVVRLFIRDVTAVVLTGALVGLAIAIPVGRFVGQSFTGAAPSPLLTITAAAVLVGTAMLATMIPALRAARTDPTGTLRRD